MRLHIFGVNQRRKRKEEDKERDVGRAGEREEGPSKREANTRDTGRCGFGATSVQKSNREQGKQRSRLVEHLQQGHGALSHTGVVSDR